jgi:hypothetical protein
MRKGSAFCYSLTLLIAVMLLMAGVTLSPAQEREEGIFDNEYQTGLYDEGEDYKDDWHYDAYGDAEKGEYWYGDYGWYNDRPYYSGAYAEAKEDDNWFYDAYDTVNDLWNGDIF